MGWSAAEAGISGGVAEKVDGFVGKFVNKSGGFCG